MHKNYYDYTCTIIHIPIQRKIFKNVIDIYDVEKIDFA